MGRIIPHDQWLLTCLNYKTGSQEIYFLFAHKFRQINRCDRTFDRGCYGYERRTLISRVDRVFGYNKIT